jgi:hypothetical protein
LQERASEVRARFELAAARIAGAWLHTGRITVSREDFRIAGEFLEGEGWTVEEMSGVCIRLACRDVPPTVVTREVAVLIALRRLSLPDNSRRSAMHPTPARRRRVVALLPERTAVLPPPLVAELSSPARSAGAGGPVELPA